MSRIRITTAFLPILFACLDGSRPAFANVVPVTDQSTYNQATSGLTTIDFNAFVPSGQTIADYSTSTGLVTGPITFTGPLTSGTWQGGTDFLYAVTPAYYSAYNAYPNSPTVLSGPPGAGSNYTGITGSLDVAVGGNYSAVASGLYVVTDGATGASSGNVQIAVTDLTGTYDFAITTSTQNINFVGFLSTSYDHLDPIHHPGFRAVSGHLQFQLWDQPISRSRAIQPGTCRKRGHRRFHLHGTPAAPSETLYEILTI